MTPERWRRIGELFEAAVRIDPAGREAWLRAACGGDDELRTEVGRLLAQHERVHPGALLTPPQAAIFPGQLIYRVRDDIGDEFVGALGGVASRWTSGSSCGISRLSRSLPTSAGAAWT